MNAMHFFYHRIFTIGYICGNGEIKGKGRPGKIEKSYLWVIGQAWNS